MLRGADGRERQIRGVVATGLALWAVLFGSEPAGAQSLDELGSPRGFTHLSVEDGLSHSNVLAIVQDHEGYLWLGTYYGLNRYDGHTITVFYQDPLDVASLAESSISKLLVDREGTLWIGTWGGGLDRFDPSDETFVHYPATPSNRQHLQDDRIQSLFEDRDGILWIGTFAGGLSRLDRPGPVVAGTSPGSATRSSDVLTTFRHDPENPASLSHDRIWDIDQDPDGRLWVATDAGLSLLDPATATAEIFRHDRTDDTSLSHDLVRVVYVDGDGTVWAGTQRGLDRFDRERHAFRRFSTGSEALSDLSRTLVASIYEDHLGDLWVGTGGGLHRYAQDSGAFEQFLPDTRDSHSLSGDHVGAIYEDRSHNLWVGTRCCGADRLDLKPAKFRHAAHRSDQPASLSDGWVFGFAQDREERLWIATRNGLDRYDESTGQFEHFRHDPEDLHSLPADDVRAVVSDPRGDLWVSVWRTGISRLPIDAEGFIHYRHDPENPGSLTSDTVESLFVDRSGTLWAATRAGLDRFERDSSRFVHYRHRPGDEHSLSDDYVQTIYEDSEGSLWVGTNSRGLARLASDRTGFDRFPSHPGDPTTLSSPRIHAIAEDSSGKLWVGTANGLNELMPNGSFRRYYMKDGLPSNRISAILPDREGGLWLSTFGGLSKFTPSTGAIRNYAARDGLRSRPFIRGACFEDSSGRLYFGSEDGFDVFDPGRIIDNPRVPAVVLTTIRLFDQPMKFGDAISRLKEIELGWRDDVLTFGFAALDFTSPKDNRYRFKLEGFDHRWSADSARREARYTGLGPGRYTFRVQGSNSDGVWNVQGAALAVTILPPPWKTWWAHTLYALVLALAVVGYVRWQRRKAEHERHLERLVEEKMSQVKILSGLLPICASCKKIRNDKGYWSDLEVYIDSHSEAHFSHGICPVCIERFYVQRRTDTNESR